MLMTFFARMIVQAEMGEDVVSDETSTAVKKIPMNDYKGLITCHSGVLQNADIRAHDSEQE